ncbi:GNAT family N-acetyltransferase [Candidatus Nitrosotenuis chungbukensis]|nr:GNAT family N-acetyltransferase [Candidatus Nitrosotenuis chungbukensis]
MNIHLRSCTRDDWDIILDLRNQFYLGSFILQDRPLTKKEHYEYMEKQLTNPHFHQWMAIMDNNVVGYIRILDLEINILVVKEYQNKGVGTKMLQLLENEAKKLNIKKLRGSVRADNLNSKQLFEKNNYKLKMYWFEKELD